MTRGAPPPARRSLSEATGLLLELGENLARARDLEAALKQVTRVAVRLTRSKQGSLRLLDDTGQRLLCSARTGPSVHRRAALPFRLGEGFIGWVVVHREPALSNNVAQDARFVRRPGQRWTPSAIVAVPLLACGACIGVLSVVRDDRRPYRPLDLDLLHLVAQHAVPHLEIARLTRLGECDALTLLHNRRHLQHRLPAEVQRVRRSGRPLTLAMLDLDHFKRVNDSHGHDVGDEVLSAVAERLRRISRGSDVVVRWGGEEFLTLFPETDLEAGLRIAERIRTAIGAPPMKTTAGEITVTASLGVATLKPDDDEHTLVKRADRALYRAKKQGRDRVVRG